MVLRLVVIAGWQVDEQRALVRVAEWVAAQQLAGDDLLLDTAG
jgi:hypothetical protein